VTIQVAPCGQHRRRTSSFRRSAGAGLGPGCLRVASALTRYLPDLTAQERESLRAATGKEAHCHGGETKVLLPEEAVQPAQPARSNP
jgi:hypothetical protein